MNTQQQIATIDQEEGGHPLVLLRSQLEKRGDEFRKALPAHITPEKLQRTIVTAAQNNPDLLSADRKSLITAAMKAAQDGLLPDGREAAFVAFNTRQKDGQGKWVTVKQCQYMPMVYGLRKKIVQSGEIVSLQTGVVYRAEVETGKFLYEVGLEPPIRHRPMLDLTEEQMADDQIVAAYSIARMKDGSVSAEVMRRAEIDKVRQMSQTGAVGRTTYKGDKIEAKGPWVDWFGEMARKTVMRRHSKTLPMSGDIIIDVEGQEHEVAISAARILDAVEPDAPVSLPSHDAETGEVIDQDGGETQGQPEPAQDSATGMTEVDEETARALDAGEAGNDDAGDAEDQSPETGDTASGAGSDQPAAQAATESEKKSLFERMKNATEAGQGGEQESSIPAWVGAEKGLSDRLRAVSNAQELKEVDEDFVKICASWPDQVRADFEQGIAAKRKEL